jgi:hypothetical protein
MWWRRLLYLVVAGKHTPIQRQRGRERERGREKERGREREREEGGVPMFQYSFQDHFLNDLTYSF